MTQGSGVMEYAMRKPALKARGKDAEDQSISRKCYANVKSG